MRILLDKQYIYSKQGCSETINSKISAINKAKYRAKTNKNRTIIEHNRQH